VIFRCPVSPARSLTFGAGEGLSEYTAPFNAIASIFEGEAEITIDQKNFTLKEGRMIILPANIPHALRAGNGSG